MTPFGEAVRKLRQRKGVSQKQMAAALNVAPAYLSALEHGKRGLPTFDLLQRIAGYFNIIWDEAEELFMLARGSDPRVVIDNPHERPSNPLAWQRLREAVLQASADLEREDTDFSNWEREVKARRSRRAA